MTKVHTRYFQKDNNAKPKGKGKRSRRKSDNPENKIKKIGKTLTANDVLTYKVKPISLRQLNSQKLQNKKKTVANGKPVPKLKKLPIDPESLERHSRGVGLEGKGIKTKHHAIKLKRKEKLIANAQEEAAHAEILLTESAGFLEADDGERTTQFTQKQIIKEVDISAATKHFELTLDQFGPYRMKYNRSGRYLLLGGHRGHLAAFDWVTKKLLCEINVMECIYDISWLHIETMMAVAQKDWVYIYDNQGIELHCIKRLNKVQRMEFLPYHFLLATASDDGFLSWLDISIGELVTKYNTNLGRLNIMTQNPYNALLCVGHARGVVSMWSPNTREPLAKMLCHNGPLTSVAINPQGTQMATSAVDKSIKLWDIRKLSGPLQHYKLRGCPTSLSLSHKSDMMAVGMGNIVEVYRDSSLESTVRPYLRHKMETSVQTLQFCPHEDILGVSASKGFTSLLVPGSGEPNFDARECNPFQTKSQRREAEVHALLEKIPADLITLDPNSIAEVDVPTLKDKIEAKKKLLFLKPPKVDYKPRNIGKRRGASVRAARNKKIVQEVHKR
ncbi:WD repeat-containing protein 46-like [Ctenocephalides felis]|uniref:WD repeat-containing protein 46-like n=1 Tax=Ctenocephalides felis TaxID=7515 RepID=UPI000E6E32F4|nr:WD repeat-containing protein 46-like [Ctenocephalides felis]